MEGILWCLGFVAASFSTKFWHLFLSQGLLIGIAGGLIWLPSAPIIAQWYVHMGHRGLRLTYSCRFTTKRSLAQGIASSGSGIVGVIFSVATTPMIERLSLAWALRITGLTSFIMLLIASVLMKDRYSSIRPNIHPCDTRLLKRKGVQLLVGYTFFSMLGYIVSIYSLSSFAISIGLSQEQGGELL